MKVRIVDDKEEVIWERGEQYGVACRSYVQDGTQHAIIEILTEALQQAKGELSCFDHVHRISDVGASTGKV